MTVFSGDQPPPGPVTVNQASKGVEGVKAWPPGILDATWARSEPLITPEQLRTDWLKGIPLVSAIIDPVTKKYTVITDDDLKNYIELAISNLEMETGLYLMQISLTERQPFDMMEFRSFGFFKLRGKPCTSVEALRIAASDGTVFFDTPKQWIETGYLHWGQLNILPLSPGTFGSTSVVTGGPAATVFLTTLQSQGHIPAYWTCQYTCGWPDDAMPKPVNNLIGIEAAIHTLALIAATYQRNSTSLSMDGLSQSVSLPGPDIYNTRIQFLQTQKKMLVNKLKKSFGLGILTGNV